MNRSDYSVTVEHCPVERSHVTILSQLQLHDKSLEGMDAALHSFILAAGRPRFRQQHIYATFVNASC